MTVAGMELAAFTRSGPCTQVSRAGSSNWPCWLVNTTELEPATHTGSPCLFCLFLLLLSSFFHPTFVPSSHLSPLLPSQTGFYIYRTPSTPNMLTRLATCNIVHTRRKFENFVCTYRPEFIIGYLPWLLHHLILSDRIFHWIWNLAIWLDWLTKKPQGSYYVYLPRLGLQTHGTMFLLHGCRGSKHFTNWAIS